MGNQVIGHMHGSNILRRPPCSNGKAQRRINCRVYVCANSDCSGLVQSLHPIDTVRLGMATDKKRKNRKSANSAGAAEVEARYVNVPGTHNSARCSLRCSLPASRHALSVQPFTHTRRCLLLQPCYRTAVNKWRSPNKRPSRSGCTVRWEALYSIYRGSWQCN